MPTFWSRHFIITNESKNVIAPEDPSITTVEYARFTVLDKSSLVIASGVSIQGEADGFDNIYNQDLAVLVLESSYLNVEGEELEVAGSNYDQNLPGSEGAGRTRFQWTEAVRCTLAAKAACCR